MKIKSLFLSGSFAIAVQSSRRMVEIAESTRGLIATAGESGNRLSDAVAIFSELVKKSTFRFKC